MGLMDHSKQVRNLTVTFVQVTSAFQTSNTQMFTDVYTLVGLRFCVNVSIIKNIFTYKKNITSEIFLPLKSWIPLNLFKNLKPSMHVNKSPG